MPDPYPRWSADEISSRFSHVSSMLNTLNSITITLRQNVMELKEQNEVLDARITALEEELDRRAE